MSDKKTTPTPEGQPEIINLYLMLRAKAQQDHGSREVKYDKDTNLLFRPGTNEVHWGIHDVLWHLGYCEEEVLPVEVGTKTYYLPRPIYDLLEAGAAELAAFGDKWVKAKKS